MLHLISTVSVINAGWERERLAEQRPAVRTLVRVTLAVAERGRAEVVFEWRHNLRTHMQEPTVNRARKSAKCSQEALAEQRPAVRTLARVTLAILGTENGSGIRLVGRFAHAHAATPCQPLRRL